jgi:hypothetical protein
VSEEREIFDGHDVARENGQDRASGKIGKARCNSMKRRKMLWSPLLPAARFPIYTLAGSRPDQTSKWVDPLRIF